MDIEKAILTLGMDISEGDLISRFDRTELIGGFFNASIESAEPDQIDSIENAFDALMALPKYEPPKEPEPRFISGEIEPGTPGKTVDAINSIIDKIRDLPIDIEICGTWVWVDSGKGNPANAVLKDLGFKFSPRKKRWSWHNGGRFFKTKTEIDMDTIREKYGSERV